MAENPGQGPQGSTALPGRSLELFWEVLFHHPSRAGLTLTPRMGRDGLLEAVGGGLGAPSPACRVVTAVGASVLEFVEFELL